MKGYLTRSQICSCNRKKYIYFKGKFLFPSYNLTKGISIIAFVTSFFNFKEQFANIARQSCFYLSFRENHYGQGSKNDFPRHNCGRFPLPNQTSCPGYHAVERVRNTPKQQSLRDGK